MTMVCDRCGEAFPLSNDVKYMTPFDDELDRFESNSIVKCLAGDDKGIYSIRDETVVLCPSCMAKLNDWLKGEQKQQAKWICDHESNSIECDKCGAEYKLSPYERVSDFDYCPNCGAKNGRNKRMSKKISDILPKTEILAQLAEEASELAQAALKLRRALDGTNPTPKSVKECQKAFEEEYADVMVCMVALDSLGYRKMYDRVEIIASEKYYRWLHRLQDKEQSDE